MTELLLVRHGHVADNDLGKGSRLCGWTDPPLSALGRKQAQRLAIRLARAVPASAAVYSSTSRRALETAATVAAALRLPVRAWPSLREIGCGSVDGWTLARVRRRYPRLWAANMAHDDAGFAWPGGETYRRFRARVLGSIRRIARQHPGQRVVVVTHAGAITQALGALQGVDAARWDVYRAGNASVTRLEWNGTGGTLLAFDDRSHLEGLPWRARRSVQRRA